MEITKKDLANKLRYVLRAENIKVKDLAPMFNTSEKYFYAKMSNGVFTYDEVNNLLDKLGYDVIWVKRNSADSSKHNTTIIDTGIEGI